MPELCEDGWMSIFSRFGLAEGNGLHVHQTWVPIVFFFEPFWSIKYTVKAKQLLHNLKEKGSNGHATYWTYLCKQEWMFDLSSRPMHWGLRTTLLFEIISFALLILFLHFACFALFLYNRECTCSFCVTFVTPCWSRSHPSTLISFAGTHPRSSQSEINISTLSFSHWAQ